MPELMIHEYLQIIINRDSLLLLKESETLQEILSILYHD